LTVGGTGLEPVTSGM